MTHKTDTQAVEVGEIAAEGLRLWRARQAVEHSAKRLEFQESSLDGIMTRASQTLGWSVTLSCAFLALAGGKNLPFTMSALGFFSVTTAFCTLMVMRPADWAPPVQTASWFLKSTLPNELAILERQALSYEKGIIENRPRLKSCALWLGLSWVSFALMPVIAALTHVLTGK